MALLWIIIGAVFDFFDGMSARLLHVSSPIGKELDSLADDVTFGVAPSTIVFSQLFVMEYPAILEPLRSWLPYTAFIIAAFSALRLAKFNLDERQTTSFIGVPTPANALFFVALGWMDAKTGFNQGGWVLLMVPAMSWLLISPVRMFAFKFQSFAFKGNEIRYIFIALAVVLLVALGIPAVPIVILLYIAISAVGWGMSLKKPGSAACPEK